MKHTAKLFLSLCCLAVLNVTYCQEPTTTSSNTLNAQFGAKLGINLSNMYVNEVKAENARVGFQAGFFAKAPINNTISFAPELIYSQKGATLTYDNLFAKGEATFTLHYVELPLLFDVNLNKNISLHAGPYASYLAGAGVKNKSTNSNYNFEESIDKDNFESFDYGVAGGIHLHNNAGGVGLRYSYGLQEVGKEQQVFGKPYRFSNAKNSVLQLYVSIPF